MIDRLRTELEHLLKQLTDEADRVRRALAALDPRGSSSTSGQTQSRSRSRSRSRTGSSAAGQRRRSAAASRTKGASASGSASTRRKSRTQSTRTSSSPGATRAAVLAALQGGEAMTATEVASRTGLARGTVSTTLSRLAKSGEVQKADRGYRVASAAESA